MRKRWIAALAVGMFLFSAGCSKKSVMPPGHMAMPMMKEDPRSIMSVEGVVEEMDSGQLVVHTKKNVHLKFQEDEKTIVAPAGKKLVVGMNVKIEIEHLPRGMRAKTVQIQSNY